MVCLKPRDGVQPIRMMPLVILVSLCLGMASPLGGAELEVAQAQPSRCVALGLFTRKDDPANAEVIEQLEQFVASRRGLSYRLYDLDEPGPHVERFEEVKRYFGTPDAKAPAIYGCNYLLLNLKVGAELERRLKSLLTINIYVRAGCPRCARAKVYVARIKPRYSTFDFRYHEVTTSAAARQQVQNLSRRYNKGAVSVPVFHFCNQLVVGWNGDSTGRKVDSQLDYWTFDCPRKTAPEEPEGRTSANATDTFGKVALGRGFHHATGLATTLLWSQFSAVAQLPADDEPEGDPVEEIVPPPTAAGNSGGAPLPTESSEELLPPPPGGDALGPPPPAGNPPPVDGQERPPPTSEASDVIDLPLFGSVSMSRLGMPVFTLAVGLIDGFNPCAMWVLLFLLSILVNLKSRLKILAVAGTFVFISGVAYFAFMAAWLNVIQFAAHLRAVQITLGLLAVGIGSIHVKDFFALKKGISLSIPESAKPGIYSRVRRIVMAENLTGAIAGASVLAILVNLIELLCTAGLPSLYTAILTMQGYAAWKNYAYLALYNVAYMFDDAVMVTIVMISLSRHKLQETEGRWLKLISGVVVLALGVVMLVRPDLLELLSLGHAG